MELGKEIADGIYRKTLKEISRHLRLNPVGVHLNNSVDVQHILVYDQLINRLYDIR